MAILSWKQRAALVKRYTNLRGKTAVYFLALTQGESSGNTHAYNGEIGTYGLWQIDASSHRDKFIGPDSRLYNPIVNVQVAEKVYRAAGNSFGPWAVHPNAADLNNAAKALNSNMTAGQVAQLVSSIPDIPGIPDLPDIPNPFGDIPNPLSGATDFYNAVKNALGWVTEPHNWLRVATFVGGLTVLLVGAYALMNNTKSGQQIIGLAKDAAITAATKGKGAGKAAA